MEDQRLAAVMERARQTTERDRRNHADAVRLAEMFERIAR